MSQFTPVLDVADLPSGQGAEVTVGGQVVALFNVNGTFHALAGRCPHGGGPLGQGFVDGPQVRCPWHNWTFDVTTGENVARADLEVARYAVKVEDGRVWVRLASEPAPRVLEGRYHPAMDTRSCDVCLESFTRCRDSAGFLEDFYGRFMASSEEVRAKFAGTDMKQQARMLEDSLYVIALAVQAEEGSLARSELPRIAARHSRQDLDISAGLYDVWLECLIESVRAHDPRFSAEVAAAWRETMAFGIDYMRARY